MRLIPTWRRLAATTAAAVGCVAGGPTGALASSVASPTIAMPDGVRLAADVSTPASDGATRFPAVLLMTPYGRATQLSPQARAALTQAGLALVFVDVRGTGASEGRQTSVFSARERADLNPILDWIANQPWSNGQVISTGASYDANLASLALATNHPVVAAAMPRFVDFDTYRDLAVPGGVRNEMFLRAWGRLTDQLNDGSACVASAAACSAQPNVKPVDGDDDRSRLRRALAEHNKDWHPYPETRDYAFEDDRTASGIDLRGGFLSSQRAALAASRRPVQLWGSWFDASTADSALDWWSAASNAPIEIYLGAWTHGGGARADPFISSPAEDEPGAPSVGRQFLDFASRALASPPRVPRVIHYYTAGAAIWRTTAQWPPANIAPVRWYLAGLGKLATSPPAGALSVDRYKVDYAASTGSKTRWSTQLGGGPVDYGDRAIKDAALLTYTSDPLDHAAEITGTATVDLRLVATRSDGALFVYLETVAPGGRVTYLSEGELRLSLRGPASAANSPPGVDPAFLRKDFAPLKPGKPFAVGVRLHAVSARVPRGYRLRIAIAGADADTFARYPASGDQTYSVYSAPAEPSFIDLPQARWRDAASAHPQ
jgi:putative CocE/NonD family hydrolase